MGKHRVINFINFLKFESDRIITKLLDNSDKFISLKEIDYIINPNLYKYKQKEEVYLNDLNSKFINIQLDENIIGNLNNHNIMLNLI